MVASDGIEVNQIQEEGMFEYRLFCRNWKIITEIL